MILPYFYIKSVLLLLIPDEFQLIHAGLNSVFVFRSTAIGILSKIIFLVFTPHS
ncbi:MAG: hypothetical protein J6562_06480 [Candidatus Schmidhempelia sp.]|nr:hypothetical protein [Candidatus Schmidhempelia sp.]